MALYPNVAAFADNRFDCCHTRQRFGGPTGGSLGHERAATPNNMENLLRESQRTMPSYKRQKPC